MTDVRLRITHAALGTEQVVEGDAFGDDSIRRVRAASAEGVELGALELDLLLDRLLGAAQKSGFPQGRHRAVVETSADEGATWSPVLDGSVVYEDVAHGRAYPAGGLTRREWAVTVRQDAAETLWLALGEVELQDVAADLAGTEGAYGVEAARIEGDPPAPVTVATTLWGLRESVAAACTLAGVTVAELPDAFPHEVLYDGGGAARLHSEPTAVAFGRPQMEGAPERGAHPTMPEESAAWLLEAWAQAQQLTVAAEYAPYPDAAVRLVARDPHRLPDPAAPPVLVAIDDLVHDDFDWSTERGEIDGEAVEDFAVVLDGGPDGSAVGGAAYQTPTRAAYAGTRISMAGTAPERTAENRTTLQLPWRLCPLDAEADVQRSSGAYAEQVSVGRPAYPVEEAYLPAAGSTAEQAGEPGVVRLVSLVDVAGAWRAVAERRPAAPIAEAATGELWAHALFRRHALAVGDVDVVRATVDLGALDLSALRLLDTAHGLAFAGLGWALRRIDEDLDARTVELELVRPTAGWGAEPAPDAGTSGAPPRPVSLEGSLGDSLYTEDQGQTTGYEYDCTFVARVPDDSATPLRFEIEFDPSISDFEQHGTTRATQFVATTQGQPGAPLEDPHPYAGQQARARAVYASGPTAWTAWTTAT